MATISEETQRRIEEVRTDNASGAMELAAKAAAALAHFARHETIASPTQFSERLSTVTQALVEAQPAMTPLFNLAREARHSVSGLHEVDQMREALFTTAQTFQNRLQNATEAIAESAAALITDHTTLLTTSYSSTVLQALLQAREAGKQFDVICTESRPAQEGVTLAKKLAAANINVTLVVDAAVFTFLSQAQWIMVGADTVAQQGLVNKIGTSGLALAAHSRRIGFYALCSTVKFLPPGHEPQLREPKDPREILPEPIANVTAVNYYFDLTPLEYLTGVITESGQFTPSDLKQHFKKLKDPPMH